MCSPSELSGMGAEQVEQVTVGRMTEARSSIGLGMSRDMVVQLSLLLVCEGKGQCR